MHFVEVFECSRKLRQHRGPRRQTSCRFSFQADDPRWSDDKCREINIHQSSLSKH